MKKRIGAIVVALSIVALWSTPRTQADPMSGRTIFMPTLHVREAKGFARPTSNMTYHGGQIESTPKVYISWWGPEWSTGFTGAGVKSSVAQSYTDGFFSNVGGSSWDKINSQYCSGVATGTVNCGTSGLHVQNNTKQLAGDYPDTTAVPSSPSQSDIANAAIRLAQHFGYDANATYFVYTPSGKSMSGFGTSWCAWHSVTTYNGQPLAYAYMPYMPDAGSSCGANFISSVMDGFSVVGGHEYAEALTDPQPAGGSYAWEDKNGSEIGDKCAWSSSSGDINLGGSLYAVQPLWSNAVSGCAMTG